MDEVKDLQYAINEWHKKNFQPESVMRNQLNLTEEVGELSRAIVKMEQGIRGTKEEWMIEAYKEIGDVLISLTNVAGALGIDVSDAWMDRWNTILQRDWIKDTVQHGVPNESNS